MSQRFRLISFQKKNRRCIIKLNRPKVLNAFNTEMLRELESVLTMATEDDDLSVLVLTGSGRGFSAGEDLKEGAGAKGTATLRDKLYRYQHLSLIHI